MAAPRAAPLELEGVTRSYGERRALDGVTLRVEAGEIFALLGRNGAGKTTLISVLSTALRPTAGTARVLGCSVVSERERARALVGVVPQDVALYPDLDALENLESFGAMYGLTPRVARGRARELLAQVGLESRARDRVRAYSGGMKRRLNLAVGLIHGPAAILLDEPTVGVDPESREQVFAVVNALRERGAAVLYATHLLEEAERLADRIGILDRGRLVAAGPLEELLAGVEGAEVTVRGVPAGLSLEPLARSASVVRLEREGDVVRLTVRDGIGALGPLAAALGALAGRATIELSRPSLERAFWALTGGGGAAPPASGTPGTPGPGGPAEPTRSTSGGAR